MILAFGAVVMKAYLRGAAAEAAVGGEKSEGVG